MKLAMAWNVWDNYEDLLIGSEIVRCQNEDWRVFDSMYLFSQGGYPDPPSEDQRRYLDDHLPVDIDEDAKWIRYHIKYRSVYRVMNGLRQAYQQAYGNGCEYAVVTNADAWCLDLRKVRTLLESEQVRRSAISARIGLVTGLDLSWGSYVPFFDDHFLVLNIELCHEHKVFEYDVPRAYDSHFLAYGGIHYIMGALMDERVPPGLFHAYTHMEDCVNHFGELCGYNLLPWQYQPSLSFLHANAVQEPLLHPLRSEMLRLHEQDRFPAVAEYCRRHPTDAAAVGRREDYVYIRQATRDRLPVRSRWQLLKTYYSALRATKYERYERIKEGLVPGANALEYFDRYDGVLPLALSSRRSARSLSPGPAS